MGLERIRVLLVDLTAMLREIVKGVLEAEPTVDVVGELAAGEPLLPAVEKTDAEVVIFATDQRDLSPDGYDLLDARPRTKVLALVGDGREAFLYELRPSREALGELTPWGLIEALHAHRVGGLRP